MSTYNDLASSSCGKKSDSKTYSQVRPNAYQFYWFMKTPCDTLTETKPIIIWLQGGPGGSGTGWVKQYLLLTSGINGAATQA